MMEVHLMVAASTAQAAYASILCPGAELYVFTSA